MGIQVAHQLGLNEDAAAAHRPASVATDWQDGDIQLDDTL
jgi:hypothetical protein